MALKVNFLNLVSIVTVCLCILDVINFTHASSSYSNANMVKGRDVIVQLFEWRFDDIAEECENFLGPRGFGGVQVSPINECPAISHPTFNPVVTRPWWERYQPISYKIASRSGDEKQFADMVRRCNKAGVRIYVDVVLNHMSGNIGKGYGVGGSYYDSEALNYTGVPYTAANFHPKTECGTWSGNVENWNNETEVRVCKLTGLNDLDQGQEYVRNKMIKYLNKLISLGVAGFRYDASKHIYPQHLTKIAEKLSDLSSEFFPQGLRPFQYHEVAYYGGGGPTPQEYLRAGRICEFRYPRFLASVIWKENQLLKYLRNFGEGWGMLNSGDAQVFVENHDTQRQVGNEISYRTSRQLKMATAFMLAWPYGVPRILSGYNWPQYIENGHDINDWYGPPHDTNYEIMHVTTNKDLTCGNGWTCEHRWRQIFNMVLFRNVVGNETVQNWWDNGFQQIAFSRGNKGFIAINNEDFPLNNTLWTGLPAGLYCDQISGIINGRTCTGRTIPVKQNGLAHVFIDNKWEEPLIAIHIQAKIA